MLIFRIQEGIWEMLVITSNSVVPSSPDWTLFNVHSQAAKPSKPNAVYADHALNLSTF